MEISDIEETTFRKETFKVHVRYSICVDTGEQFTTTEQDELFCNELYNQYRERHGFPYPDEIRSIRERFCLNYTQISKIMGFGINQWKQYEDGNVPSESNAKLILAVSSKEGMKKMAMSSSSEFNETEFNKIICAIDSAKEEDENFTLDA